LGDELAETPSRGSEIRQTDASTSVGRPTKLRLVVIAGVLTLIAGVLSVYNGVVGVNAGIGLGFDIYREGLKYSFCGVFLVVFGIIAIVGGLFAIKGRHVILAIIGACLGMAGGGLAGFWLGLTAMVLFFLSDADLTD
jgi:uncharacterized membrane protein HdeD (DUF308 family)